MDGKITALGLGRPRAFESASARETVVSLLPAVDVLLTTEAGTAALGQRANPTETVHALASAHEFTTVVLAREQGGALVWHNRTVHGTRLPKPTPSTTVGRSTRSVGVFSPGDSPMTVQIGRSPPGWPVGRSRARSTVRSSPLPVRRSEHCVESME